MNSVQYNQEWVMVKMRDTNEPLSQQAEVQPLRASSNQARVAPSVINGLCKVRIPNGINRDDFINSLKEDSNIIYVEPIVDYQLLYVPLDPDNQTSQSYLNLIGAFEAWDLTRGDDDLVIGIIDSGIDLNHEDIQPNIWINSADPIDGVDNDENGYIDDFYGYDFADRDTDPSADGSPHGTEVGGLAGATTDNGIGISSIGFNTKIASLKGFRTADNTANNLYEAIIYAVDNGIKILNLSWGAISSGSQAEQDIINYAVLENDVVVVAAGGNTDIDAKFFPASYENVLSIGATDVSDNRWSRATYNYSIDLMAPGVSVYTTTNDNLYKSGFGTSLSAPLVAGTAALVKSYHPELNALQIMERIRVTTDDIYGVGTNSQFDGKLGKGRLNVFNAVSANNVKSLRVTDFQVATSFGSDFFFGDTVTVSIDLTNYLENLNEPEIHISSPTNQFTTQEPNISLPTLVSLADYSTSIDIIVNDDLEPNEPVDIRLDIYDGVYSDFQFLELSTAPDYISFGSNLEMTVAGNGNLGYADTLFQDGVGMTFDNLRILQHSGLMIATTQEDVSDNFINNYTTNSRSSDFDQNKFIKYYDHPAVDEFIFSQFTDSLHSVTIEQSVYNKEGSDFLLLKYRLTNYSIETLENVTVGFYSDYDIPNSETNTAERIVGLNYNLTKDESEIIFAGSKIIGQGTDVFSLIDLAELNGNTGDISNGQLDDQTKYSLVTNPVTENAGIQGGGNNVSTIVGNQFSSIESQNSEEIWIILAAGNTQVGLEASIVEAETLIDDIVANPRVLETVISCEGSQVTLNPSSGDQFRFFRDPTGTDFLAEGSSFQTGTINSDTAIYVQNIDGEFPSEIFQLVIALIEDVAQFSFSPDTLYLDNATNVISFQDESINPVSWLWSFGEGTSSDQQNPMLSYNSVGNYDITLEVENDQGCIDSETKTLVVANRPPVPTFENQTLCPGSMLDLNDGNELHVYATETSQEPITIGTNVTVGPFSENTTIFVSRIVDQFESLRQPLEVSIIPFDIDLQVIPDTLSSTPAFVVTGPENLASQEWFLDGSSIGSDPSISVNLEDNGSLLQLTGSNDDGCTLTENLFIDFSTSPTPSQSDLIVCAGEAAILEPQNGDYFEFYSDEELTNSLHKGTMLEVSELWQVYIVGLDDGLAGNSIEVNITYEDFQVDIDTTLTKLSGVNQVTFTPSSQSSIASYEWIVNEEIVETTSTPTLFFSDDSYEIILNTVSSNSCQASDTLRFDFAPIVLGNEKEVFARIYPNPSSGIFSISSREKIANIRLLNIKGQELDFRQSENQVNISSHPSGVYFVEFLSESGVTYQKIVLDH